MKIINKKLIEFSKKRGWDPTPHDIAKSIIIEAAELLEHYQFDDTDVVKDKKQPPPKNMEKISLEVADVYWYLILFCKKTGINLKDALELKMKKHAIKYPEEAFNGKFNEEFYNKRKKEYRKKKIN